MAAVNNTYETGTLLTVKDGCSSEAFGAVQISIHTRDHRRRRGGDRAQSSQTHLLPIRTKPKDFRSATLATVAAGRLAVAVSQASVDADTTKRFNL